MLSSRSTQHGRRPSGRILPAILAGLACVLGPPASAQTAVDTLKPRPTSATSGFEFSVGSGHSDRGFVISDRPVFQPVVWVSGRVAEFSVWGNLPLAQTSDGLRPEILELELVHNQKWGRFTVAPAVRTFYYRDPLTIYSTHSVEGWLTLSYGGAVKLFTEHSVDLTTYRGAYYGAAGIKSEGHVSQRVELGGSVSAGWASSQFNVAYIDVPTAGWQRISAEGWLTTHVTPHYYLGPYFVFSSIVNPRVRAELDRPSFVFVGLTTGIEF